MPKHVQMNLGLSIMSISRILVPVLASMAIASCATEPLTVQELTSMDSGKVIANIYRYASYRKLSKVQEGNLEQLINSAEQRQILDIGSLTRIKNIASGGFWPEDTGIKAHDIELTRGAPTLVRRFTRQLGRNPLNYTVWEYIFTTHFPGGQIVDNRVLCILQDTVLAYAVLIDIRIDGVQSLIRTSSSPGIGCGDGQFAYFAEDFEYRGIFGEIRGGQAASGAPVTPTGRANRTIKLF
jgi:hypothetical protein